MIPMGPCRITINGNCSVKRCRRSCSLRLHPNEPEGIVTFGFYSLEPRWFS